MTEVIVMEPEVFARLEAVKRRLYDQRPLSGDDRRDLANTLDALLAQAQRITID